MLRRRYLRSRIPSDNWVFCWDARRNVGYLLVTPRAKDREALRFAGAGIARLVGRTVVRRAVVVIGIGIAVALLVR